MEMIRNACRRAKRHVTHHHIHAVLEVGYLSFYLTEGLSLRTLFVIVLMVHTSIEIFKAE